MKTLILLAFAALSAFAADTKKPDPPVPTIKPETQIRILLTQLAVTAAQLAAQPYNDVTKRAQEAAEPPYLEGVADCGEKHVPVIDVKAQKVGCQLKPEPPAAKVTTPTPPPVKAVPTVDEAKPVEPTPTAAPAAK